MARLNIFPWTFRCLSFTLTRELQRATSAGMRTDQLDGPIYPRHAPFVADHIARPINQIEHLSSVSERNNQRRITPDPFVGKPNTSFALSKRPSNGAIGNSHFRASVLFRLALKSYSLHLVKKIKRALPPTTVGRRIRFTLEMTQKEEREAINAALKRLVGEDGFRTDGAFGKNQKFGRKSGS